MQEKKKHLEKKDAKASLQEVNVTVISNAACKAAPRPYKENINEAMLCAAAPGKDSCQV